LLVCFGDARPWRAAKAYTNAPCSFLQNSCGSSQPGGLLDGGRGSERRAPTPGWTTKQWFHPGGVTEPPITEPFTTHKKSSTSFSEQETEFIVLARPYARRFWHPSGVLIMLSRFPGGLRAARGPPATIWQPSGLRERALRARNSARRPIRRNSMAVHHRRPLPARLTFPVRQRGEKGRLRGPSK
jgi:hypothetical protein